MMLKKQPMIYNILVTLQASFKKSDRYKEKKESLDRDMLITFVGSEFDFFLTK